MHGKTSLKLSRLLRARHQLMRHATLANSAYAYQSLLEFGRRIEGARLKGAVTLKSPNADAERNWATLTAVSGQQSLLEEFFTEEDVMDLVNMIAYITAEDEVDLSFRIEDFNETFVAPLRAALEHAGVTIDRDECSQEEPSPREFR